ncbi:MAG: MBL fold metallo-hydrolase, partial [Planctomycetota bacterium]
MAGSNKSTTTGGIRIDILGCSDPFSRTGRSSTYRVHVGGAIWLVDCGSPIFHLMEADEIKAIDGVIITHSHDDHRRWLTDLALYRYYICRDTPRLQLVANAALHEELEESSRNALQRSLSFDSSKMIDVPYSAFFDVKHIGPAEKFRVARIGGEWRVIDRNRTVLPASQAKVVVNPAHPRPRMLLRDDTTGAWVEPQIYYGLKSPEFYEAEHRSITGGQGTNQPFTIRIIRSTAWHGMEVIGVVFETADERVMFSSDTAFNPELFRELTDARREPSRGGMTHEEFDAAFVVEGDINDFVERGWSEARYAEAMSDYSGVVFHDTAPFRSIVHTDYRYASQIGENLVLVHTPDRFASTEVLGQQDKTLEIIGKDVYERTADGLMMLDAAVYVSAGERYY